MSQQKAAGSASGPLWKYEFMLHTGVVIVQWTNLVIVRCRHRQQVLVRARPFWPALGVASHTESPQVFVCKNQRFEMDASLWALVNAHVK
jgi:hypothetical protein